MPIFSRRRPKEIVNRYRKPVHSPDDEGNTIHLSACGARNFLHKCQDGLHNFPENLYEFDLLARMTPFGISCACKCGDSCSLPKG